MSFIEVPQLTEPHTYPWQSKVTVHASFTIPSLWPTVQFTQVGRPSPESLSELIEGKLSAGVWERAAVVRYGISGINGSSIPTILTLFTMVA